MGKVDVVVNVFGKPWQTLCSLKSLMKWSGSHIDKIYFIEEKKQLYNDNVKWVIEEFNNIIHYTPTKYNFIPRMNTMGDLNIPENRYGFRYQYGIEKSDKEYVFIIHNDILFTGDIIGDMLDLIGGNAGVGQIGQCHNCPCSYAGICNGDKFNEFKPTYSDILNCITKYPPARGQQFINMINKNKLIPLPECRLNEFACLVNRPIYLNECYPNGNSPLFGSHEGIDTASAWFSSLYDKGYKFKHYDINRTSKHMYFAKDAGYQVQLNYEKYANSEMFAKEYYQKNF